MLEASSLKNKLRCVIYPNNLWEAITVGTREGMKVFDLLVNRDGGKSNASRFTRQYSY